MPIRLDDPVPSPTSTIVNSDPMSMNELVEQMNQVIKLLQEQKVWSDYTRLYLRIEYNYIYSSIWSVVPWYRCSSFILL